ncbi:MULTISPECIES: hypothetical protein [unclassified Sphingobacterium]|uniref:hypothetical protein n=1 Tax=unclassified Sphingobacterium TaxID=2609468 RepID=UPI0025763F13|nr:MULTISPECIES: hypothetical protein [unclassified Sphingobacterium]MDM1295357.1 hypothetical protein [Sphingobacterium sp. N143]
MTKEEINHLCQELEHINKNFEEKSYPGNAPLLKQDFNIQSLNTPNHYLKVMDEMNDMLRKSRVLFLNAVLDKVCLEEGKVYDFAKPFQAGMSYFAVTRKEGTFYLKDEDGDYREIFSSEEFVSFIDDLYWELYEEE